MSRKIGISYCRNAIGDQTVSDSEIVKDQLTAIESYAFRHGITINQQYIDVGYSGLNPDRPALKKMLDDLEKSDGQVSYLLIHSIEKLSRDMPGIKQLIAHINQYVDNVIVVREEQVIDDFLVKL